MYSLDWEFIKKLMNAVEVLQDVTLEFSKKGVLTICKVLPLYKLMETKLAELADKYEFEEFNISRALHAGSKKAKQYIGKALISDSIHSSAWKYSNSTTMITSASTSKSAKGIFAMAVKGYAETKKRTLVAGKDEVDMYFSRLRMASTTHYKWWKNNNLWVAAVEAYNHPEFSKKKKNATAVPVGLVGLREALKGSRGHRREEKATTHNYLIKGVQAVKQKGYNIVQDGFHVGEKGMIRVVEYYLWHLSDGSQKGRSQMGVADGRQKAQIHCKRWKSMCSKSPFRSSGSILVQELPQNLSFSCTLQVTCQPHIVTVKSGKCGRPCKEVNWEFLCDAMSAEWGISVKKLAEALHILAKCLEEAGVSHAFAALHRSDLDELVKGFWTLKPDSAGVKGSKVLGVCFHLMSETYNSSFVPLLL
ncbi:hypothetical protein C8R44DRAFT_748238 [Mycena epipterygia]|nr:hypothetical protein C8R44DRAFT_748238 [Mycena epipterygia]